MKTKEKQIKEIEVHEAEPINVLATIKASALIDVSSWKEKQLKLVAENPFFDITDSKTYEAGKKHRTNVVKGRTELQNQEKLVVSTFTSIRKEVGSETEALIQITKPLEDKWQEGVKNWEDRKEREKKEAEEKEELRIKTIQDKIEDFETDSYTIIQKMTYAEIISKSAELSALDDPEFDYEEYDILYDQVKDRITETLETKVKSLTESENQRLDNIRLENENAEAKRISELQASRLTEIMPYVAFGASIDLTKLSEMTDDEYQGNLSSKKGLFEADAKLKADAEAERLSKEAEEKDAIYEIREKRLIEAGMIYSAEHNSFWTKLDTEFIILEHDIYNEGTLEFENTLVEVKGVIEREQLKIEQFKFRSEELNKIGFTLNEQNVFTHPMLFAGISKETILESNFDEFDKIISDAKKGIFDKKIFALTSIGFIYDDTKDFEFYLSDSWKCTKYLIDEMHANGFNEYVNESIAYQKRIDEEKSKADAEKLKAENKARIKQYAGDKKALTKFVKSLEFRGAVPELENEDLQPILEKILLELENSRGFLLTEINLF